MIYDKIKNVGNYKGISKWLDLAIDYMQKADLMQLPLGRTEIYGEKVFINVMEAQAGQPQDICFEIHKKYMDIQIDLEGVECVQIGLGDTRPVSEFREDIDFGSVVCTESASCVLGAGRFIVCMAEEPHKPGITVSQNRHLKKCVFKVAVE